MNIPAQEAAPAVDDRLGAVLRRQRLAFEEEGFPPASVRVDRLRRAVDLLHRFEDEIIDALEADFGHRPWSQSFFTEIVTTTKPLRVAMSKVRRWMRPERRSAGFPFGLLGAGARVRYQPLGVVGIISPWNFPVNLSVAPLAGVLAAGNRAMIKPSEMTPHTADLLERMFASAFDPSEVAVATGGMEVGEAFSRLPFDHLLYTGGAGVARHIMKAAADNLTPLTLELGGKSPVIVGSRANIGAACERIAFGKVLNAGQICLAPDYALVPDDRMRAFVDTMRAALERQLPADRGVTDFVSIVNERHAERLRGYVREVRNRGVEVIELGWTASDEAHAPGANMVPLTIIVDPPDDTAVMREEIFGPLLVVKGYRSFEEALAFVSDGAPPLALYYFGKDRCELSMIETRTRSGAMAINDVISHYTIDDLPFGGVGSSGMGAYHGVDGFRRFSHGRAIYRQTPVDIGAFLRPPFGSRFERMTRLLAKYG